MTTQGIESMKVALRKLEAMNTAAADALRACDETKAKAEAAYAAAQTPQSKRALRDAREDEEDARVVAGAAAKRVEAARTELAATAKRMLVADYEVGAARISPEAIQRGLDPIVEACKEIERRGFAVDRAVEEFKAKYLADVQTAVQLAQRADIHPPRACVTTTEQIRELVMARLRSEVPAPAGTPAIHNWTTVVSTQSRYAS